MRLTFLTAAAVAALSVSTFAASTQPQMTNTSGMQVPVYTGHDLTPPQKALGPSTKVLYCPSEADDPAFRALVATAIGGGTVDYFDTRVGEPALTLLQTYDSVYCWANYAFNNNIALGDVFAKYVDLGGTVILGPFTTYTSGNHLSGAIMTSAYCPVVSPLGNNHFSSDTYQGDGTTCLYDKVASLTGFYRDYLTLQGNGVKDGTYFDGEICGAYNCIKGAGRVVHGNGSSAAPLGSPGDWPTFVANATLCTLCCKLPTPYGSGCPGSGKFVPVLEVVGCPSLGSTVGFKITQGLGGAPAFLFLGIKQAKFPLGYTCTMNVNPFFGPFGPVKLLGSGPGAGAFKASAVIPKGAATGPVTVQAFVVDKGAPLGFSNSNGVELLIQP